jgi:glycosyltransferase involved in cell wall biosynthesis
MRIGIDAKWYFKGPAGPRSYVHNIVNWLARIDYENDYLIYLNKNDDPSAVEYSAPNFTTKTLSPSQSWLRVMLRLPTVARRDRLDILYTFNFCPLFSRTTRVVMIFDIIFVTHPGLFTRVEQVFFKPVRLAARLADSVVTISEYCKDVIADRYRIDESKVTSILLGCDEAFGKIEDEAKLRSVRERYDLPERFILYVGRINIRKNIGRLIEAFSGIQDRHIKLVLVGAKDWKTSNLAPVIEESKARDRMVFLGYVPDEDLPAIYQLATVFAYVPLVEGFGLPPLESMGVGTPVITSNTSSIPEVVGDCALKVDPYSVEEMRAALDRLLGSQSLQDELAGKGIERASSFSWEVTALQTLDVFRKVASSTG